MNEHKASLCPCLNVTGDCFPETGRGSSVHDSYFVSHEGG